jgi:hypothetical protein
VELVVKRDWPAYVVVRDGRYLQEREIVAGFHWQTTGVAWVRSVRLASKFPRTIAMQLARDRGGVVVSAAERTEARP